MTPRWKIRRGLHYRGLGHVYGPFWDVYYDGELVEAFFKWENALTYIELYERA